MRNFVLCFVVVVFFLIEFEITPFVIIFYYSQYNTIDLFVYYLII
jgi:hypothetical protein